MTESEAIEYIKNMAFMCKKYEKCQYGHQCTTKCLKTTEMAIQALKEIREYRELGTVEELKFLVENVGSIKLLKEYSAIGTVEEFKALKEKNTPMELAEHNFQDEVHHYLCPSCRNIVSFNQNYCEECGQALEN